MDSALKKVEALDKAVHNAMKGEILKARLEKENYNALKSKVNLEQAELRLKKEINKADKDQVKITNEQAKADKKLKSSFRESQRQAYMANSNSQRQYRLQTRKIGSMSPLDRIISRGSVTDQDKEQARNYKQRIAGATSIDEIARIKAEMSSFVRTTNSAAAAQERLQRQLQQTNFAMNSLSNSAKNMARSYLSVFAVTGAAGSVYQQGASMDSIKASMLMGSGNKAQRDEDLKIIIAKAMETGQDLPTMAKNFSNVVVSAKEAGLSRSNQMGMFDTMTTMGVAYGLSTEQQKLVGKAFAQIAGKQQVMAEEFKNQLGDNAPAVMGMLGQAAGITDSKQLQKAMEKGQLGLDVFLKFGDIVRKRATETGAYQEGIGTMGVMSGRIKNQYTLMTEKFWNSGGKKAFERVTNFISDILERITPAFEMFGAALGKISEYGTGVSLPFIVEIFDIVYNSVSSLLKLSAEGWGMLTGAKAGGFTDLIGGFWDMMIGGLKMILGLTMMWNDALKSIDGNYIVNMVKSVFGDGDTITKLKNSAMSKGASSTTADMLFGNGSTGGVGSNPWSLNPTTFVASEMFSSLKDYFNSKPTVGEININVTANDGEDVGNRVKNAISDFFSPALPASK